MRIRSGRAVLVAVALACVCGCGTNRTARTDEEQVEATVEQWREAMVAGDVERLMGSYSEDFRCFDAPDRAAMRAYLEGLEEQGVLEDVEIFVDGARSTPEGEVVRVFPVEMLLANGSITVFRLTLRHEDGGWRIVDQEW